MGDILVAITFIRAVEVPAIMELQGRLSFGELSVGYVLSSDFHVPGQRLADSTDEELCLGAYITNEFSRLIMKEWFVQGVSVRETAYKYKKPLRRGSDVMFVLQVFKRSSTGLVTFTAKVVDHGKVVVTGKISVLFPKK